ncbi:MAG: beta-ketoacyl-ACP synthase [Methylococcales bacterium]
MIQPYLNSIGVICTLGDNKRQVLNNLLNTVTSSPTLSDEYSPGKPVPIAEVNSVLPDIPATLKHYQSRTNQLLLAALEQIRPEVDVAIKRYGRQRVAVIIGTSTSGIAEGEAAISYHRQNQHLPAGFTYKQQEIAATSEFISRLLGTSGPVYAISTSCSSGSSAICSARRLLVSGLCDAVIVGGADALCGTTIQGFSSLGAISKTTCNPFSRNRDGIVIGEGAALFLVSRDDIIEDDATPVQLLGVGISSDAHHISAPDPSGQGAQLAMKLALDDASLKPDQVDYINLHGTATPQNDAMESRAVCEQFPHQIACSSTKPLTGHCLGASGAIELALCWLLVADLNEHHQLPTQLWDQQADPMLPQLNLLNSSQYCKNHPSKIMSNTYSFGGNNVSLIIGCGQ